MPCILKVNKSMLKFSRNKLVSIYRNDSEILSVHGILDDDIYSLEIDVDIRISDLKFLSIDGKWNRYTTPDCPRAIPVIQEAVGFCIDDEVAQKINKIIGRKACRHFANLLNECCDAAKEAAKIVKWEDAKANQTDLTFEEFLAGETRESLDHGVIQSVHIEEKPVRHEEKPLKNDKISSGGYIIDLHVHTSPASPCSSAPENQAIEEAKRIGLDAICLTDHNYVWKTENIEDLKQKHGFLVFRGNEITTDQGDILVFGMNKDIKGIIKLQNLKKEVLKADGFMIAAHPFRGFLVFGAEQLGLTTEKAMARSLFKWVDAVEVLNGKVTEKENNLASEVTTRLGLLATGGSDAHEVYEVGQYATRFYSPIKDEKDLINALRSGNYSPVAFREDR